MARGLFPLCFVVCSCIAKDYLRIFLVPVAVILAPSVAGVLHLLLHPTLALCLLCAVLALAFLYRAFLQVRLYAFAAISTASHCDLILDRAERRCLQRKHRLLEKRLRKRDACLRRQFGSRFLHFLHCLDWFMMFLRWCVVARALYIGIILVHLFMKCLSALLALLATCMICYGYLFILALLMKLPLCQQLLKTVRPACTCFPLLVAASAGDCVRQCVMLLVWALGIHAKDDASCTYWSIALYVLATLHPHSTCQQILFFATCGLLLPCCPPHVKKKPAKKTDAEQATRERIDVGYSENGKLERFRIDVSEESMEKAVSFIKNLRLCVCVACKPNELSHTYS